MARRSSLLLVFVVIGSLAAVPGPSAKPAAKAAPRTSFGSAIVVDPVHAFAEPGISVSPQGRYYVHGPWGTGTQRSLFEESIDGGNTYRTLHDVPALTPDQSVTTISGPGGGDTEVSIDREGKVYYSDLAALVTLKLATWDPEANEMLTSAIVGLPNNANGYDRQWFVNWDPPNQAAARRASGYRGDFPVNYLLYTEAIASSSCGPEGMVEASCESATYSTDGLTYSDPTVSYLRYGFPGHIAIDQLTGTVFQATGKDSSSDISVAILTRDRANPQSPALTDAELVKIADLPLDPTAPPPDEGDPPPRTSFDALFPVVTLDAARNAYVTWVSSAAEAAGKPRTDLWQVWYSWAPAASGWKKWSRPAKVSRPPANTAVMPWVVAGAAGRIAISWYGTDNVTEHPGLEDAHQEWHVYTAMVTDANSSKPRIEQVRVTRHPMHYGTICLEGTLCLAVAGNRNAADFFEVAMDPRDGAVVIVYNDMSNELAQQVPPDGPQVPEPVDGVVDHRGAPVVTLARQNGGIGLLGKPIKPRPSVGTSMTDPAEEALWEPVYGPVQVKELDLRGVKVKRTGEGIDISVAVESLDDIATAHAETGARAVTWVARWTGAPADSQTGVRNPIYYAAAESLFAGVTGLGGAVGVFEDVPLFYGGTAQSVELCSVSGCYPHLIEYPRPPLGGTTIEGAIVQGRNGAPDTLVFHVPADLVGNPARGTLLESFGVYAFARNKSSALPFTNAEGEAGIAPILVDGICCLDMRV